MTPERNRPAKNPGGMQCERCDEIFIGEEWHQFCGLCIKIVADEIARSQRAISTSNQTGE